MADQKDVVVAILVPTGSTIAMRHTPHARATKERVRCQRGGDTLIYGDLRSPNAKVSYAERGELAARQAMRGTERDTRSSYSTAGLAVCVQSERGLAS